MNKKANAVVDGLVVVIFLIVFGFIIFFGYKAYSAVNTQIQADASWTDTTSKDMLNEQVSKYPTTFDNMFIVVFILLWGLTLVASFNIDTHPIFFVFTLILLIIVFFITPYIGNAVETIMLDDIIATEVNLFPKTEWVLTHLLTVMIIIGSSIMLVLFAKNQGGQY